jgi:DNA helicase-2/ATP-dependent DNA helicase PcrA
MPAKLILKGLSSEQRVIVTSTAPYRKVKADAGTSKTYVAVRSVAHDLLIGGFDPEKTLVLAFNKCAKQIFDERLAQLGVPIDKIKVCTIHGFCYDILKQYHQEIDYLYPPTVVTEDEQRKYFRNALKEFNLYSKKVLDEVLTCYGLVKNLNLTGGDLLEMLDIPSESAAPIFRGYRQLKDRQGKIDFDDMLTHTLRLLQSKPAVLADIRKQFQYIYIDEAQDVSVVQWEIIKLINPVRFMACGDDKQCIYSWRGARSEFIDCLNENFEQFQLNENRRSTPEIVALSNLVLNSNTFTPNPFGPKPLIIENLKPYFEARSISDLLIKLSPFGTTAVLARNWDQLIPIQLILIARGIKFRLVKTQRNQMEDVIKFFKLFEWALKKDKDTWEDCAHLLKINQAPMFIDAFPEKDSKHKSSLEHYALSDRDHEIIQTLNNINLIEQAPQHRVSYFYELFYSKFLYKNWQLDELQYLINKLGIDMGPSMNLWSDEEPLVSFSTIHGVKGDTFTNTVLVGLVNGKLPHKDTSNEIEERRLFYVAVTRPRHRLILSTYHRSHKNKQVQPSIFLNEIRQAGSDITTFSEDDLFSNEAGGAI